MAAYGRARRAAAAAALACALLGTACGAANTSTLAKKSEPPKAAKGGLATGSQRRALAAKYLTIAKAGNVRLNIDFDGLEGHDRNRLGAAKADLRDAVATERLFDRRLLRIEFPSETERVARLLYEVNQARARLTAAVATITSLHEIHVYESALSAANGPVEQAVRTIRHQLGLPPPSSS